MAGKSHQDRELAAKVRHKVLNDIYDVLDDSEKARAKVSKWSPLKLRLIEKMSNSVLPRINEHTGKDGDDLFPKPILDVIQSNNSNTQNNKPVQED